MRAPTPSFKAELSAYRQRLDAIGLHPDHYRIAIEVLDRWAERPDDAEEVWDTLRKKLPTEAVPSPMAFIDLVLDRRLAVAEELNVRIPEMRTVEADARRRAVHLRRTGQRDQAAVLLSHLNQFQRDRDHVLGRKMKQAPQRDFMIGWSDKFTELCGEPLDRVAAFLTEVAFGAEVSMEATRQARRSKQRLR